MKYVNLLGLLAVATAALAAVAGSASATVATSPKGSVYTGKIVAVGEGHISIHSAIGLASCESHLESTVERHGAGVTLEGKVTKWTLSICTEGVAHVKTGGVLIAHPNPSHPGVNAILTSTGATIEITNPSGVNCSYTTNNTSIGTLTGSSTTGGNATVDISASITRHAGSFFCGSAASMTGVYKVTTPAFLNIS